MKINIKYTSKDNGILTIIMDSLKETVEKYKLEPSKKMIAKNDLIKSFNDKIISLQDKIKPSEINDYTMHCEVIKERLIGILYYNEIEKKDDREIIKTISKKVDEEFKLDESEISFFNQELDK